MIKKTTFNSTPPRTSRSHASRIKNRNFKAFKVRNFQRSRTLVKKSMNIFYQEWKHQEHSKKNMNIFTKRGNNQEHSKKNMNIFAKRGNNQEHSKKNMNIFSSFHLKILVIRRTKLQAFLSKQNKRVKITTSTQNGATTREEEEEEEEDDGSS